MDNTAKAGKKGTQAAMGRLFVVSAPSGTGKTTMCLAVCKLIPALSYSISYTTRNPRWGEQDGIDYHFITKTKFKTGIAEGKWAEWAEVYGNYYGTSHSFLDRTLNSGGSILLDIDVQGTRQIIARYPRSVTVFILPPSLAVLKERLIKRGTDDPATISKRLKNAEIEIGQKAFYRHIIVNDQLSEAVADLAGLIQSHLDDK